MVKNNVLVSGATGWLGREILNVLSEDNFEKLHLNLISSKNDEVFIKGNRFEVKSFDSYDNKSEINNYFVDSSYFEDYNMLNFDDGEELVDIGYKYMSHQKIKLC